MFYPDMTTKQFTATADARKKLGEELANRENAARRLYENTVPPYSQTKSFLLNFLTFRQNNKNSRNPMGPV